MKIFLNIKTMAAVAAMAAAMPAFAQDAVPQAQEIDYGVMYVEPLFEYPVARKNSRISLRNVTGLLIISGQALTRRNKALWTR